MASSRARARGACHIGRQARCCLASALIFVQDLADQAVRIDLLDKVHHGRVDLPGLHRIVPEGDFDVVAHLLTRQACYGNVVGKLGLGNAEKASRTRLNQQFDQYSGGIVFLQVAQRNHNPAIREHPWTRVADGRQDFDRSFGRDAHGKLDRQDSIAHHDIHGALDLLPEDGHRIGGVADKFGLRATTEQAYFIQQAFIPVGANAEGIDDNTHLASLLGKLAALLALDGTSIGQQDHAIDGIGN